MVAVTPPCSTPVSAFCFPSTHTWNVTEPLPVRSSSTPTSDTNRTAAPFKSTLNWLLAWVPIPTYSRLFLLSDDPTPELQENLWRQEETDLKYGVRTVNEIRSERGLPPVAWGDQPFRGPGIGKEHS